RAGGDPPEESRDDVVLVPLRRARDLVDVRLELAPAREPVLARDGELRVRELRFRLRATELCELLLRGLAEPLEVGTWGQRRCRHGRPPSRAPGVRGSRAGRRSDAAARDQAG